LPNASLAHIPRMDEMRDEIGAILSRKADQLKKELAALGSDYAEIGRIALYGKRKSLSDRKVAPKYADKEGNKWAGRGAQPVWLRDALKSGAKLEDFLISKSPIRAKPAKKKGARKTKKKSKAT
jgi:DNA-binding protein H-NS